MSDTEAFARRERRRQLIERLNQKEEMFDLARSARRAQMSEEALLEIERERNYSRRGFGQIYGGGDFGGVGGDGGGGGDA